MKALIVSRGKKEFVKYFTKILDKLNIDYDIFPTAKIYADKEKMQEYKLIIPFQKGGLTAKEEKGLVHAVKNGTGMIGCHSGMGDAYRTNTNFQFIVGGQFVAHPGGFKDYTVTFCKDDLTEGLENIKVHSEQYYMHIDFSNEIVATTYFEDANIFMPIAWKRWLAKGKIFYCSLGHTVKDLQSPQIKELFKRAIQWVIND